MTLSLRPCAGDMCQRTFSTLSRGPVRKPNQPLSFLVIVLAAASVADWTADPAAPAASVTPSPSVAAAASASVIMETAHFALKWSKTDGPLRQVSCVTSRTGTYTSLKTRHACMADWKRRRCQISREGFTGRASAPGI